MRKPSRLLVTLLAVWLCLCGVARAQGADNSLRIWYSLPERYAGQFQQLLAQYQQSHPTVAVEGRNFPSMEALHSALVNGDNLPHIALIDSTWQDELIKQGHLVQAEEMMARISDMCRITLKADTFPCMFDAVVRDTKVWTTPAFAISHALLYDKDALTSAGFKAPPHRWADIVLMGPRLTQVSGMWAFSFPTGTSSQEMGRLLEIFSWQVCPRGVDTQGVDNPQANRALQYWVDLINKYKITPPGGFADRTKSVMFVGTTEDLFDGQSGGRHLEAAPMPSLLQPASDISVFTMAQFNVDPQKADRTFQAIEWLTDFQQMLTFATSTPYIPANKQITLSPGYFQYMGAHSGLKTFVMQLPCARVDHPHPAHIDEIIGDAALTALNAKQTTQQALAQAQQQADAFQPPSGPTTPSGTTNAPAPAPTPTAGGR